jgi:hypothetical protein
MVLAPSLCFAVRRDARVRADRGCYMVSAAMLALSNLISNVPAVIL